MDRESATPCFPGNLFQQAALADPGLAAQDNDTPAAAVTTGLQQPLQHQQVALAADKRNRRRRPGGQAFDPPSGYRRIDAFECRRWQRHCADFAFHQASQWCRDHDFTGSSQLHQPHIGRGRLEDFICTNGCGCAATATTTKVFPWCIGKASIWTSPAQRSATLGAELASLAIVEIALRAPHRHVPRPSLPMLRAEY